MSEIVMLRLVTGEQLIGKLISRNNNVVKLSNACLLEPHPQGIACVRWPVLLDENEHEIELKEEHVLAVVKPTEALANDYNVKHGSGLVTPSSKLQLKL